MRKLITPLLVLVGSTSLAFAENSLWKTEGSEKLMIQEMGDERVLYCWDTGGRGIECDPLDATREGDIVTFEKLPFVYTLTKGVSLKGKNKFTDSEKDMIVTDITQAISASKYEGAWGNVNETDYQITSYDPKTKSGKLNYRFRDFMTQANFKVYGGTVVVERDAEFNLYFVQAGTETIANFISQSNGVGMANLHETPFSFKNDAQCAQAHLNFLGFNVGKADGQPGAKSKAGSRAYLDANVGIELDLLAKSSATAWCSHLTEKVGERAGVVALSGL